MGIIFGILGLVALIIMFSRIFKNERKGAKTRNLIEHLKQNPEAYKEHISRLVHMPFYVNMEQIPQWNSAIRSMPETFRIAGAVNVNYWQIVNENEVFMIVVGEHSTIATGSVGRQSMVNEVVNFSVLIKVNHSTGNYEMKTRLPETREEKSLMATFGRKFFEALQARQ